MEQQASVIPFSLRSYGLTDIGAIRQNNEDVYTAAHDCNFFALADGMGGHLAGEVAAQETISFLTEHIRQQRLSSCTEWIIELRDAIERVNRHVYRMGRSEKSLSGMGTTLCCMVWTADGVVYAHVGDSRVYLYRQQKLTLLTQDHSLLTRWFGSRRYANMPKGGSAYKHVITRSIGTGPKANPEVASVATEPHDLFFLCSDGLTDVVSLAEMESVLNQTTDLEQAGKKLVEIAKIKGSSDNMTVLLIGRN
ncbi:MAG: protein phosphatase prpC [Chlamydiota bacterium]|jgi:protein phosphatase